MGSTVETELYVIRHELPVSNCADALPGLYDRHAQLTVRGMERAIQWLWKLREMSDRPFAMVATSELVRARQTALPIVAGGLACECIVSKRLNDWRHGSKDVLAEEYERQHADDPAYWTARPFRLVASANSRRLPRFGTVPGASAAAKLYDASNQRWRNEAHRFNQRGLIQDWIDTYAGAKILWVAHASALAVMYDLMHPGTHVERDEALSELPIGYGEAYVFHVTTHSRECTHDAQIIGIRSEPLRLDDELVPPTVEEMGETFLRPNRLMDARLGPMDECRIEPCDARHLYYHLSA